MNKSVKESRILFRYLCKKTVKLAPVFVLNTRMIHLGIAIAIINDHIALAISNELNGIKLTEIMIFTL